MSLVNNMDQLTADITDSGVVRRQCGHAQDSSYTGAMRVCSEHGHH